MNARIINLPRAIVSNKHWKDAGSRVDAVVRALVSHQCVPDPIPGPGGICGLSLLLVLYSAPRGLSPGTLIFPVLKNQHFQFPIRS